MHEKVRPPLWPVGTFNLWHKQFNHIKGNKTLILMHNCIVNGYHSAAVHFSYCAFEPHRGTAAFFYSTHFRPFPLFLFMCLSLRQSYFFSWVPLKFVLIILSGQHI